MGAPSTERSSESELTGLNHGLNHGRPMDTTRLPLGLNGGQFCCAASNLTRVQAKARLYPRLVLALLSPPQLPALAPLQASPDECPPVMHAHPNLCHICFWGTQPKTATQSPCPHV